MDIKNKLPQVDSKKSFSFHHFIVHVTVQIKITHSKHKRLFFVNDRRMKSWNALIFLSDKIFKYNRKTGSAVSC